MPTTNIAAIRTVLLTLSVAAILCVLTICLCAYFVLQIPPELNTLAGALVGSLGSMLVKTTPNPVAPPPITQTQTQTEDTQVTTTTTP